jgi:hypothetical protein
MKKLIFFALMNFCLFGYSQNPTLRLKNKIDSNLNLPQNLNKNDICLIYEINGGWSAYDFVNYYFINENGILEVYQEERPKSYLKDEKLKRTIKKIEPTKDLSNKIIKLVNSKQLTELLKYKQEDFKIKIIEKRNSPPSPCMISDNYGFKLTFIQSGKQNSYDYYAPKYYYEKCNDETINKPVLKKFIDVINLF